jgi:Ca2+-binding EF-hand superfamily protein
MCVDAQPYELDRNNDGFLEQDDLRRAFGVNANVEALIKAADTDGYGRISYKV